MPTMIVLLATFVLGMFCGFLALIALFWWLSEELSQQ